MALSIERALKIPGWMSEQELLWLAKQASKRQCVLEVGSWRGRSARALADNCPGVVFAVDTWSDGAKGYPGWWTRDDTEIKTCSRPDWLWHEFRHNLGDHIGTRLMPMRMTSEQAAAQAHMMKFDMIFIDGDHSFQSVQQDIRMWRPLLAEGGVFCGHDYNDPRCPEVAPAVMQLIPLVDVTGTIWCEL